jgi:hypothetical protein
MLDVGCYVAKRKYLSSIQAADLSAAGDGKPSAWINLPKTIYGFI